MTGLGRAECFKLKVLSAVFYHFQVPKLVLVIIEIEMYKLRKSISVNYLNTRKLFYNSFRVAKTKPNKCAFSETDILYDVTVELIVFYFFR